MKQKLTNKQISQMATQECMAKWDALEKKYNRADRHDREARKNLKDATSNLDYLPVVPILVAAVLISAWSLLLIFVLPFISVVLRRIFYPHHVRAFNENFQKVQKAYRRYCDFDTPTRRALMAARIRELRAQR